MQNRNKTIYWKESSKGVEVEYSDTCQAAFVAFTPASAFAAMPHFLSQS